MLSSLEYCPPISTGVVLSGRVVGKAMAVSNQSRQSADSVQPGQLVEAQHLTHFGHLACWRLAPFSPDNCSLNSCEISYARFDLLGQIQKRRDVRCYRLRFWHCRKEVTHSEGAENLAPVAYGNTKGVR